MLKSDAWRMDGLHWKTEIDSESHVRSCWGGSGEALVAGGFVLPGGGYCDAIVRELSSWPLLGKAARRAYRATMRFLCACMRRP